LSRNFVPRGTDGNVGAVRRIAGAAEQQPPQRFAYVVLQFVLGHTRLLEIQDVEEVVAEHHPHTRGRRDRRATRKRH
jgi:hypothetical protein